MVTRKHDIIHTDMEHSSFKTSGQVWQLRPAQSGSAHCELTPVGALKAR